ncbi:MAG: hypothetical protein ACUVRV_10920, partial [Cyanobacteriota bacterium]
GYIQLRGYFLLKETGTGKPSQKSSLSSEVTVKFQALPQEATIDIPQVLRTPAATSIGCRVSGP